MATHLIPIYSNVGTQPKELIAESFIIIRDFLKQQLGGEPVNLLGDETWSVLLNVAEVYGKELSECRQAMAQVDWKSEALSSAVSELRCPKCYSELIRPKDINTDDPIFSSCICSACGEGFDLDDEAIQELLSEYYSADCYIANERWWRSSVNHMP